MLTFMICEPCRDRQHPQCAGGTWCDCQHDPRRQVSGRMVDWTRVVGDALAAVTHPVVLSGTVLLIHTTSDDAKDAVMDDHAAMVERVNEELGEGTVTRLMPATITGVLVAGA